jgi:hypothetical protein
MLQNVSRRALILAVAATTIPFFTACSSATEPVTRVTERTIKVTGLASHDGTDSTSTCRSGFSLPGGITGCASANP